MAIFLILAPPSAHRDSASRTSDSTRPALHALAMPDSRCSLFQRRVTLDTKSASAAGIPALATPRPRHARTRDDHGADRYFLLGLSAPAAAILGAALASTDPVLLRTVIRSKALPEAPRIALRLETGMNDVVLLPIVILAMLLLPRGPADVTPSLVIHENIGRNLLGLFVLGPALGALVGGVGISALAAIRSRAGVRRDYESLYALGLAFTSFALAEAVGGSGFVAAFVAGLLVAAKDVELCDCFPSRVRRAPAEMLLLLTSSHLARPDLAGIG